MNVDPIVRSADRRCAETRDMIGRSHAAREQSRRLIATSRALVERSTSLVRDPLPRRPAGGRRVSS